MARKFAAAVFSLGCIHASSTFALGLGEIKLDSFLNEPLKAKVDLLNTDNLHSDEIRVRLATREDFERMGVERAYFLTSITFEVSVDPSGQGTISITSEDPVLEPYLDFIVEARWPSGRLLREYTVLVDPPLFDTTTPVVSATQRVAEVEGTPLPDEGGKKPGDPAAGSGTRVDVRKSDLADGAMPQRDFNAETADMPQSGSRYMIHRDDTLWAIAAAAKPAGATVHQTMLDIQRMNPSAFIDGNINRIKAGYIVYLPTQDDISSQDLAAALAEVKQQNEDWEAGRASAPVSSGPKLRISADPVDEGSATGGEAGDSAASGSELAGSDDGSASEQAAMAEELASVQQQVDTLQRIVNLKDDQIAALQAALEEQGGDVDSVETAADEADSMPAETAGIAGAGAGEGDPDDATILGDDDADSVATVLDSAATQAEMDAGTADATATAEPAEEVEAAPVAVAPPAPAPAAAEDSGIMSKVLYGVGAVVLALLALFFVRRRKDEAEEEAAVEDAFADVQLTEERVDFTPEVASADEIDADLDESIEEDFDDLEPVMDSRGYGEHKNDEYASDVDTSDALAEADIYIAYGRYPQAKDLLLSALASEPDNPAYRLKLLETELQMGETAAAEAQLRELEAIGDSASIARGRDMLGDGETFDKPPAGLGAEIEDVEESDFAGLEIEGAAVDDEILDDDLDLSADFADDELGDGPDEEDLVIAAEANGMSTKLDLARAYMDMGDESGARQILEEVVAEGSEEQKTEAGALLERIG